MLDRIGQGPSPVVGMTWRGLILRLGWIAIQLVLAYCMADEFQPFFYQAF